MAMFPQPAVPCLRALNASAASPPPPWTQAAPPLPYPVPGNLQRIVRANQTVANPHVQQLAGAHGIALLCHQSVSMRDSPVASRRPHNCASPHLRSADNLWNPSLHTLLHDCQHDLPINVMATMFMSILTCFGEPCSAAPRPADALHAHAISAASTSHFPQLRHCRCASRQRDQFNDLECGRALGCRCSSRLSFHRRGQPPFAAPVPCRPATCHAP